MHAIGARLGDVALDREPFELRLRSPAHVGIDGLWTLLLAAWLGRDAMGLHQSKRGARGGYYEYAGTIREPLQRCRLDGLVSQVDAAEAVLLGGEPTTPFFVSGPREQWRDVLAALQALGDGRTEQESRGVSARIVWAVRVGKRGSVDSIEPLDQRRGPRGWTKPKPLSLAKVAGSERLPPWDAKVARAIRQDRAYLRRWEIDRAAAVMALIGHPAVVLADAPDQLVDVVEGMPEVEVVKEGDRYRMRVTPSVRTDDEREERDEDYYDDTSAARDTEALRMITLVQDTPQRMRVIRSLPRSDGPRSWSPDALPCRRAPMRSSSTRCARSPDIFRYMPITPRLRAKRRRRPSSARSYLRSASNCCCVSWLRLWACMDRVCRPAPDGRGSWRRSVAKPSEQRAISRSSVLTSKRSSTHCPFSTSRAMPDSNG